MTHPAVAAAYRHWSEAIAHGSRWALHPVRVSPAMLLRRSDPAPQPDRCQSANGSCRLLQTRDGWIALNLPRAGDLELVPALLGHAAGADPWAALTMAFRTRDSASVLDQAHLLGLAAARVGETTVPSGPAAPGQPQDRSARHWTRPPRVLDLSALWAGPLASTLLARAGCEVLRVDGRTPPDRFGDTERPGIGRLADGKRSLHLALDTPAGRDSLQTLITQSDVVITGMRRRALEALGLPEALAASGGPLWLAITAHGLEGAHGDRIGLGDDCAAAGGLVDWTADGRPQFIGDAIADPLTGLRAAALALRALARGERGRLDVALAATAADAVQRVTRPPGSRAC